MDIRNVFQGALIMLFVMWANHFRSEWREVGGFFILLALFAVRDYRRKV